LVDRLERNFIIETAAEDDDDIAPSALRKEECEFTSCDIGISYPVLQAAVHRDRLHTRLKVPHKSTTYST
jgi:hypothetical protein